MKLPAFFPFQMRVRPRFSSGALKDRLKQEICQYSRYTVIGKLDFRDSK
jgi:hypothetical protein